jgi:hypothetical protein
VISRDGFIVYVIGHAFDFISYTPPNTAPPIPNTDFYILQLKINDGALMKQKFIIGNDFDYFRAVKFNRNSLFIVGDTMSVFPWAIGQTQAGLPTQNRQATFILKVNCDL